MPTATTPVIALDGPSGSGKSTVARRAAASVRSMPARRAASVAMRYVAPVST